LAFGFDILAAAPLGGARDNERGRARRGSVQVLESGAAVRAFGREFRSSISVLAGVPIARWPLLAHATCALIVVAACSTAAYVWERAVAKRHAAASTLLQHAEAEFRSASNHTATAEAPLPLADASRLDDFLRDLGQLATERSVRINSLNVGHSRATSDVRQAEVNAQLVADYTATKAWLSEVLARYPSVALHSLSMRAAEGGQLETTVSLRLYMRGSK